MGTINNAKSQLFQVRRTGTLAEFKAQGLGDNPVEPEGEVKHIIGLESLRSHKKSKFSPP